VPIAPDQIRFCSIRIQDAWVLLFVIASILKTFDTVGALPMLSFDTSRHERISALWSTFLFSFIRLRVNTTHPLAFGHPAGEAERYGRLTWIATWKKNGKKKASVWPRFRNQLMWHLPGKPLTGTTFDSNGNNAIFFSVNWFPKSI